MLSSPPTRRFGSVLLALCAFAAPASAEPPPHPGPRADAPQKPERPARPHFPLPGPSGSGRPAPPAFPLPLGSAVSPEQREKLRTRLEDLRARLEEKRQDRERVRALLRDVDEGLQRGAVDREKLRQFWAARLERKREHQENVKRRWGATLDRPEARAELVKHAERMAKLRRLSYIAATERSGAEQRALLARIARLMKLEQDRHERELGKLAGTTTPRAEPSAAASGSKP
jgi:hypothetical protein